MNKCLLLSSLALTISLFLGTVPFIDIEARGGGLPYTGRPLIGNTTGSKSHSIRRAGSDNAKLVKVTKEVSPRGDLVSYTGTYDDSRNLECRKSSIGRGGGGYSCSFDKAEIVEVPGTNTGEYYFNFLEKKYTEQEKNKK